MVDKAVKIKSNLLFTLVNVFGKSGLFKMKCWKAFCRLVSKDSVTDFGS